MYKLLVILTITALGSCGQPSDSSVEQARILDNYTKLQTFPIKGGWGYSIEVNGKKFIRQETIPVLQGQRPFATKEQAQKVGNWVASRIRHNEEFSLTLPVLQGLIGLENRK